MIKLIKHAWNFIFDHNVSPLRHIPDLSTRHYVLQALGFMWAVAFSDGAIGHQEERLMHLAGELLGIEHHDLVEVRGRLQTPGRR